MEMEGWLRRMVTGKALTITLSASGTSVIPGNDYVADSAWSTGDDCASKFEWEFPSGAKLAFDCVLNVTNPGGGESRDVAWAGVRSAQRWQAYLHPRGGGLIHIRASGHVPEAVFEKEAIMAKLYTLDGQAADGYPGDPHRRQDLPGG